MDPYNCLFSFKCFAKLVSKGALQASGVDIASQLLWVGTILQAGHGWFSAMSESSLQGGSGVYDSMTSMILSSSSLMIRFYPNLMNIPMTADPHILKVMEEALIASCQLVGLMNRIRAAVVEFRAQFWWSALSCGGSGSFVSLYWRALEALEALDDLKSEFVLKRFEVSAEESEELM